MFDPDQHSQQIDIGISPAFRGVLTPQSILSPQATIFLVLPREGFFIGGGEFFSLQAQGFLLKAGMKPDATLFLQRNNSVAEVKPALLSPNGPPVLMTLLWSPTELTISCKSRDLDVWQLEETKVTPPTFPPQSLIRFARQRQLLPSETFRSEEGFRASVYEELAHLRNSIERLGTFNAFWDQHYDGQKKLPQTPKRETDIHPTLQLLLEDWAMMHNVEVIPENKTGVGNLDFALIGMVDGVGLTTVCVEVKLAHANDLRHGLEIQLPAYMQRKRARYGAYVVLWFKGPSFNEPGLATIQDIASLWMNDTTSLTEATFDKLDFVLAPATSSLHDMNVLTFLVDLSKPPTASKA